MSKHTPSPAPWRREDTPDYAEIYSLNGHKVALVDSEANANLIAQAPALLEALEDAITQFGYLYPKKFLQKYKAILAAAKGESA